MDGSPACVEGSLGLRPEPGVSQGWRVELSSCGERWGCPIFPGGAGYPSSEDVLCAEQVSGRSAEPTKALTRGSGK